MFERLPKKRINVSLLSSHIQDHFRSDPMWDRCGSFLGKVRPLGFWAEDSGQTPNRQYCDCLHPNPAKNEKIQAIPLSLQDFESRRAVICLEQSPKHAVSCNGSVASCVAACFLDLRILVV